jgi:hypothetical protein
MYPCWMKMILGRESGDGGETMGPEVRQIRGREVSPSAWARSPLRHDRCSWCCVQNKNKIRIQYAGSHMQQFRLNKGWKERRGRREAITRLRAKLPGEVEVEAPKRSRRRHNDSPHRHSLANWGRICQHIESSTSNHHAHLTPRFDTISRTNELSLLRICSPTGVRIISRPHFLCSYDRIPRATRVNQPNPS